MIYVYIQCVSDFSRKCKKKFVEYQRDNALCRQYRGVFINMTIIEYITYNEYIYIYIYTRIRVHEKTSKLRVNNKRQKCIE